MPRLIETDCADDSLSLGDLVEQLETGGFDPEDEESIAAFGPALGRLGRNRRFLGDLVIEELKQGCAGQVARNQYSAQVILLHGGGSKFALRANFWPAEEDSVVVNSGTAPFFYDVPHDHNFSFLTVGYFGPGYASDYYEYDYGGVTGAVGERAKLRFVERSSLSPGKVLLYRKHRDVHRQLPPDSLSVSLNILALSPASDFKDQYLFDLRRGEVAGFANANGLEALVALAARLGGGNGADLVESFARAHPSERIRFAAWRAKAAGEGNAEARIALYERAAAEPGAFVAAMARREAAMLKERLRAERRAA
ncbi:MAG: hypothetical protein QOE79_1390 [Sphingomonadales bacterium]|jgi:hypothetical protein|nr:hypothetical protein [Sphingomonadales bacterium]